MKIPFVRFRSEGSAVENGLNLYRWRDRAITIGFILKIGTLQWMCRYSRIKSRWVIG
jgi:hypothetical protein